MQVRGGDFPLDSESLASLVLLGGVERGQRVQEFMDRAREAQKEQQQTTTDHADQFQSDELDDLF